MKIQLYLLHFVTFRLHYAYTKALSTGFSVTYVTETVVYIGRTSKHNLYKHWVTQIGTITTVDANSQCGSPFIIAGMIRLRNSTNVLYLDLFLFKYATVDRRHPRFR